MLRSLLTAAALLACSGAALADEAAPGPRARGGEEEVGVIRMAQGTIVLKFFESDAPKTVANFKGLARSGFYDGTTFHRLVPGFVIQGGDPLSKDGDLENDGTGGSGKTIPGEFSATRKHARGTLSMARATDPNSATCQFFICLAPAPSLDGKYAAFGQVIQGLEVVDKLAALANAGGVTKGPMGANPGRRALMQKVTIEPLSSWASPAPGPPAFKAAMKDSGK